MMGNNDRQAYDRNSNIFSPDGRLYQVEYAREAVKQGSASVGIRTPDGVVLAAARRVRSPLLEERSVEKLHKVDEFHGVASAGHVADARQLVDVSRRAAQVERLRYGEFITTEQLTTEISEHIQEYTQSGGTRPYGAALLIAGFAEGDPRLFETDPSGTAIEWQATAIGGGSDQIREELEEQYDPQMGVEDAVALARDVLTDEDDEEGAEPTIAVITADGYESRDVAE
ncbi:archaeal proteasome endopeptidase complex subunit alpha [Halomarina oriensis]|uniref:Proteasome subunit alpha n=1 Tax=Halomarina oriensis TaxID=671145 RepID=A0A6B0GKD8_9EURY|nr:archaeal proteasome endopeptidase complex subunit alpha [Halomarina oriensis]MWG35322.1 archaeal proteasome endopeptidase complex subunit alpha [Halomarina oriensis]